MPNTQIKRLITLPKISYNNCYQEYGNLKLKIMKFKKAFKREHPETIGEKDSHFDLSNYSEWLERKIIDINKKNKIQLKTITDIINHPRTEETEMNRLQSCRRFIKGFDYELSVFND